MDMNVLLELVGTSYKVLQTCMRAGGTGGLSGHAEWLQGVAGACACAWESGGGARVRQEVCDAEVALRWSKVKDYCKILGMCAIGFIVAWC